MREAIVTFRWPVHLPDVPTEQRVELARLRPGQTPVWSNGDVLRLYTVRGIVQLSWSYVLRLEVLG